MSRKKDWWFELVIILITLVAVAVLSRVAEGNDRARQQQEVWYAFSMSIQHPIKKMTKTEKRLWANAFAVLMVLDEQTPESAAEEAGRVVNGYRSLIESKDPKVKELRVAETNHEAVPEVNLATERVANRAMHLNARLQEARGFLDRVMQVTMVGKNAKFLGQEISNWLEAFDNES